MSSSQSRALARLTIGIAVSLIIGAFTLADFIFDFQDDQIDTGAQISDAYVHFVDVGQGDCTIIQTENANIIIDAGENFAAEKVLEYAQNLGIKTFDCVIATHPHSDHISGLDDVINRFDVKKVIMPRVKDSLVPTTVCYENLLKAISNKGLKITAAKPGTKYDFDGCTLEILSPVNDYDDLNNYSVACKFTCDKTSFLFCGDIEKAAEADILASNADVDADVLKVAHHGSSTSSSKKFLNSVSPSYAVISCGNGNKYGHPHKSVTKALEDITVLITDTMGDIVFHSDGNKLTYQTDASEG